FDPSDEIAELLLGVDGPALVRPADDGAVFDFVILHRAGPAGEIATVEDAAKTGIAGRIDGPLGGFDARHQHAAHRRWAAAAAASAVRHKHRTANDTFFAHRARGAEPANGENPVRFIGPDLADEQVSPADLAAVRLQLDRARARQGVAAVFLEVVFEPGVIDHELVVEPNRHALADLNDAELVPFAERFVGEHEGVLTRSAFAVVPEPAGAFVRAEIELRLLGRIPNLHLRAATQVDAAVGERNGSIFDQEFDIAIVFVGGQERAFAVVDDEVALDPPMAFGVLRPFR